MEMATDRVQIINAITYKDGKYKEKSRHND